MELIQQFIFSITEKIGVNSENKIINKSFLEQINDIDPDWYQLLKSLYGNYQSYIFIKKDKELRIKSKDIWESQKTYFKNAIRKDIEKIEFRLQSDHMTLSDNDVIQELLDTL